MSNSLLSHNRKDPLGFTLLELMVVIAIIGILAAALFPSITGYLARAHDAVRLDYAKKITIANDLLITDIGRFANHDTSENCSGNDTSFNGGVATELVTKGFMKPVILSDAGKNYDRFGGGIECGSIIYYRYSTPTYCLPTGLGSHYYLAVLLETPSKKLTDDQFGLKEGCTIDFSATWRSRSILTDVWTTGKFESQNK